MIELKSIFVDYIETKACAGSEISACIREAIKLSMDEKVTVLVLHNEDSYRIHPGDIVSKIFDDTELSEE
ncbi:hypothetical protein LCGC14_1882310 [marine sediment metagenome]|uniref:Uncharacterized protein n=1 Tax=marine sediment metagenome TaxID=412755 RepID=A0A0F9IFU0_9ZZZZ